MQGLLRIENVWVDLAQEQCCCCLWSIFLSFSRLLIIIVFRGLFSHFKLSFELIECSNYRLEGMEGVWERIKAHNVPFKPVFRIRFILIFRIRYFTKRIRGSGSGSCSKSDLKSGKYFYKKYISPKNDLFCYLWSKYLCQ